MEHKFLILPGCNDSNRGDQALIWETVHTAKDAGFLGKYYMLAHKNGAAQSYQEGIRSIEPILPHPAEKLGNKNDIQYGLALKIKLVFASVHDLTVALLLLNRFTRRLVRACISKEKNSILAEFEQAETAFVKGGGFLHSYTGGVVDTYRVFFLLYHIKLAISLGIPVYVMPNSFGPFKGFWARRMVRRTLEKCKFVSSRESLSREMLLEACEVDSYLTNDLAVYLKKDDAFQARELLKSKNIPIDTKKCVAFTVRPYRFPGKKNSEELYEKYKESIITLVKYLFDHDFYPVFVEHVYSEGYHERDMICIQEICKQIPEYVKYSIFSDLSLNCRQMKSVYSCFDYLVGTRFHSVIFSLTENVPCIAITYGGNKGDGIMRDNDLSDFAIPMEEITGDILVRRFMDLVDNRDKIIDKLDRLKSDLMSERTALIEEIKSK